MAKQVEKTLVEHTKSAASYVVPSSTVGTALSIVLAHFFDLPMEVAGALSILLTTSINLGLVYLAKGRS